MALSRVHPALVLFVTHDPRIKSGASFVGEAVPTSPDHAKM
jgi:hypothetical protein